MKRAGFIGIVSVSLAIAACGPVQQAAPGGGQEASGQPKSGGVLNIHIPVDPNDWDVSISGKSLDNGQNGYNLAGESLLGYKKGPGVPYNEATLEGELAERWEMSPDARAFTFHLHKGLKWPDVSPVNGRAFTSEDVKFSYEYQARFGPFSGMKTGRYSWYFEGMDRIETPDPNTVVVRFKEPFPPFVWYAASDWNPIFAREIYEQDGNLSDQIVGMGPWQLDMSASQVGSRFVWTRNANYYQPGLPYIDEVRYLIIKEPGTARAAFQTKQTDALLGGLGPREVTEISQKSPDAQVFENFKSVASWRWYINTRRAPLNDVRVRRALSLALDQEKFLKTLGEGKFKVAVEGVQPGLFSDDEIKRFLRYDPQEAKRLLAQAGYPNGVDIDTTFPGKAYGEVYITGLELAQSQLKEAGIRLNLISEDKGDWNKKRRQGDYFLGLQQNSSVEADMDTWLFGSMYSKSGYNYNGINDPKMDELVFAQRREGNPEKRRELLRQLVRYMLDNVYSIGIGNIPQYEVVQPYVKNYAPLEWVKGTVFTDAWLDK